MLATTAELKDQAASTQAASPSAVVLKTMDDLEFAVPVSQIKLSKTLVEFLNPTSNNNAEEQDKAPINPLVVKKMETSEESLPVFKVPHVSSFILSKVLAFFQAHADDVTEYDEATFVLSQEDRLAFGEYSNEILLQFALAANILQIDLLLHVVGTLIQEKMTASDGSAEEQLDAMFKVDDLEVLPKDSNADADDNEEDWEELEETDDMDTEDALEKEVLEKK